MVTLVNGEMQEQISTSDRGLLYGQNLFETIVVDGQQPLLLAEHIARLKSGCAVLQIPFNETAVLDDVERSLSACKQAVSVMRVTLTMGAGERGYANPPAAMPNRIVSLHDYPELDPQYWESGITLGLASIKLSSQPRLAGLKHGNRLEQIIARSEWQTGWQEALLLDNQDHVIEATQANIFISNSDSLSTPDLSTSGVQGVMRDCIIERAKTLNIPTTIAQLSLDDIRQADEVFVCNSVIGIWPVKQFQNTDYRDFPATEKLLSTLRKHDAIPNI